MARKRKTLPKNFEELLENGELAELKAVFDKCEVNARGGAFKQTALAFHNCPDELARWLVQQGADIATGDSYGETPLHSRAGHWQGGIEILIELGADVNHDAGGRATPLHKVFGPCNIKSAEILIANGANVDALNDAGMTPLALGLQRCSNSKIAELVKLAEVLLKAGATKTPEMQESVTRIGTDFEFHRSNFNPECLDETVAGLEKLYTLFDVKPVPSRAVHDGKSPIIATSDSWQDRHQELWQLLVPSSGAAETVQGEVIRISGKISNELDGNGGGNWDNDFQKMTDAFLTHIQSGNRLSATIESEAKTLVGKIRGRVGEPSRMCELAVDWVALNPKPIKLAAPDYDR